MKKILLIDNYDSFTYNIFHSLSELGTKVEVYRNDKISLKEISKKKFDKIVISPGPGHPSSSGICINLVKHFYKTIPILGICLGHQIIGAAFGAVIKRAKIIMHCKLIKSGIFFSGIIFVIILVFLNGFSLRVEISMSP